MIKISVFMPILEAENNFEYYTTIIPAAGDKISIAGKDRVIKCRTFYPHQPNYIIIEITP